jgi:toxin ParE1/3/4
LTEIHRFIARNAPLAATRMVARILAATRRLEDFPASGRRLREEHTETLREVIVRPYRVIYRLEPNEVRIIWILHSARLLDHNELSRRL